MNSIVILSALSLGFLGSFHCIGMCGPIALALPQHAHSKSANVVKHILYNVGRVITYTLFGLAFGFIGNSLFIGSMQQNISIVLGATMLCIVLFPKLLPSKFRSFSLFQLPLFRKLFSRTMQMQSYSAYVFLGILNGLLPCGFVYIALSAALIYMDPFTSALFMSMFGLGTIPAMLSMSLMSGFFNIKYRNYIKKSVPIITIFVGLLLIFRGLNLGIPYLSPKISNTNSSTQVECCEKP
jgi:uncharacterized protein